jgi:hypothetical protein
VRRMAEVRSSNGERPAPNCSPFGRIAEFPQGLAAAGFLRPRSSSDELVCNLGRQSISEIEDIFSRRRLGTQECHSADRCSLAASMKVAKTIHSISPDRVKTFALDCLRSDLAQERIGIESAMLSSGAVLERELRWVHCKFH